MIGLNQGIVSNPAAPFGGVKQSGFGREGGPEGIERVPGDEVRRDQHGLGIGVSGPRNGPNPDTRRALPDKRPYGEAFVKGALISRICGCVSGLWSAGWVAVRRAVRDARSD